MNSTPDLVRFRMRIERTIALLNVRLDPLQMTRLADVFRTMSWTFVDIELQVFLVIAGDPHQLQVCAEPGDNPIIHLALDSDLLDAAVQSKLSFVQAFLCGRLKVSGANPIQLLKFFNLLQPFLESYRLATEVLDVES